jgi:hypothetical protein
MAIATNVMKETLSTTYGSTGTWISVHTSDPGTTGSPGEASGGAPAYARKQTTWSPGGSDGVNAGSQVTIDVAAGTYTYIGLWSAVTAGTYYDKYLLPTAQTFATQGQLLVTPTFTVT